MRLCFLTHFWITSLTFGSLNMNDLYSVDCKIISNPYVGHHLPSIENHSTEGSTTYDATYILLMYSLKKLCAVVTKMLTCKICFSKQNYFFSNMNELYSWDLLSLFLFDTSQLFSKSWNRFWVHLLSLRQFSSCGKQWYQSKNMILWQMFRSKSKNRFVVDFRLPN